jgi:hypothetical protein
MSGGETDDAGRNRKKQEAGGRRQEPGRKRSALRVADGRTNTKGHEDQFVGG